MQLTAVEDDAVADSRLPSKVNAQRREIQVPDQYDVGTLLYSQPGGVPT